MESHTALFLRTNLVANIFFFESCFKMTKEIGSKQSDAELFTAMYYMTGRFWRILHSVTEDGKRSTIDNRFICALFSRMSSCERD